MRYGVEVPTENAALADKALDSMNASELRELVREVVPWLDAATYARYYGSLMDVAARGAARWVPQGPTPAQVKTILEFAKGARQDGQAEATHVDACLHQGANAFRAKDYASAQQIYRALLVPAADADIDLGQRELIEDVLSIDPYECADQYLVAAYMLADPTERVDSVLAAINDVRSIRRFHKPLETLEKCAVDSLPEFDAFEGRWLEMAKTRAIVHRASNWDQDEDCWLREVVARTDGPEGLAEIARRTKRAEDLRGWCHATIEKADWPRALAAHEEAARLDAATRGEFLDGAAGICLKMGVTNIAERLAHAWAEAPTFLRLTRWLSTFATKDELCAAASEALSRVREEANSQRALLNLLNGRFILAADQLASAPGLGWSYDEHPGHLLSEVFARIYARVDISRSTNAPTSFCIHPPLPLPKSSSVATLVDLANISAAKIRDAREAVISSMREAAESRLAGVVENKRRRHYDHAAALVGICVRMDHNSADWVAGIRLQYRRYPALQQELDRYLQEEAFPALIQ